MAIRWIEGWRYRGTTQLELDYTLAGAGLLTVAELPARRAGCYAATLTNRSATRAITCGTRVIVGCAFAWTSGAQTILHVMEGSITHCSLGITSGGVLTAYRGTNAGTSLGAGATLTPGTVYYIEVDATVHDTTGSFSTWVDDVADIALTNVDTRDGGTPGIDAIRIEGGSGGAKFADLYVVDPVAAGRSTRKGASARVDCRLAIANGSKADFTPNTGTNWQAIDDDGHDADTTYVQSQVSGARDLYPVTQMTHNPTSVDAIQVHVVARKADAATRTLRTLSRTAAGDVTPGAAVTLTTDYQDVVTLHEDNGTYDDGAAFTQQAFNGRQFGFEVGT